MKINLKNYRPLKNGETIKETDIWLWDEKKGYEAPHDWMVGCGYHSSGKLDRYCLSNIIYRKINTNRTETDLNKANWK